MPLSSPRLMVLWVLLPSFFYLDSVKSFNSVCFHEIFNRVWYFTTLRHSYLFEGLIYSTFQENCHNIQTIYFRFGLCQFRTDVNTNTPFSLVPCDKKVPRPKIIIDYSVTFDGSGFEIYSLCIMPKVCQMFDVITVANVLLSAFIEN